MSEIDVQFGIDQAECVPSEKEIMTWARAALQGRNDDAVISIRITDEKEIMELNKTYRHKDTPTNVLSFPMELPEIVDLPMLGDIAICAPIVEKEAREQGKTREAHWAHMVIHGTLHLQGFDHIEPQDAEEMESLEINILQQLGFQNPYQSMESS